MIHPMKEFVIALRDYDSPKSKSGMKLKKGDQLLLISDTDPGLCGRMTPFEAAAEKVKNLVSSPSNEELLEVYALFKQSTVGDTNTAQPGMLDMKGAVKWSAWNGKKGISQDDAKNQYIALVETLVAKYKLKE